MLNSYCNAEAEMDGIFPTEPSSMTFSNVLFSESILCHIGSIVNRLRQLRDSHAIIFIQYFSTLCSYENCVQLPNVSTKIQKSIQMLHHLYLKCSNCLCVNPVLVLNLIQLFLYKTVIILDLDENCALYTLVKGIKQMSWYYEWKFKSAF